MYELISVWESNGNGGNWESAEIAKSQLTDQYVLFLTSRKGQRDQMYCKTSADAVRTAKGLQLSRLAISPYNDPMPF